MANENNRNMNFQLQNQLYMQQQQQQQQPTTSQTCTWHLPLNTSIQLNPNLRVKPDLHVEAKFTYRKILQVKELLLHYDQMPFQLCDNHEVCKYLLDIIQAFKWQTVDVWTIASRLAHLMQNCYGVAERFLSINLTDYDTRMQQSEPGYYFEVFIIMYDSMEKYIMEGRYSLIIGTPFLVNQQHMIVAPIPVPHLYTLQGPTSMPLPVLGYNLPQIQNVNPPLHQTYTTTTEGLKRQRID